MSSSDDQIAGRRFLVAFSVAAIGLAAAALILSWAVDPTGLLRSVGSGGGGCQPGIVTSDERYVKPLLARMYQPDEIIVGSSRVGLGFAPNVFHGRSVANLAVSSASLREVDELARSAAAEPSLRRAWLGLDFGAFAEQEPVRVPLVFPAEGQGRGSTALRFALFDPRALKATASLLLSPGSCGNPAMTALGFRREEAGMPAPQPGLEARARMAIIRSWTLPEDQRAQLYAGRLARLDALLAHLRARNVTTILYLSPTSPAYRAMVAESGLVPLYRRWRSDVAGLARRNGARLIPSDTREFLMSVPALGCESESHEACLFVDFVHFRPVVGAAIVRAWEADMHAPLSIRE